MFNLGWVKSLYIIEKSTIVFILFCAGMLLNVWGSLNPWFLWKLSHVFFFVAFIPIMMALLIDRKLKNKIFTRTDFKGPTVCYILLSFVMALVNIRNPFAYVASIVHGLMFMALFRLNEDACKRFADFLCKSLAVLLCVSIPFYVLYLLGFNLPHTHIVNEELMYSYENFRFFLLDDRQKLIIIPRFHSVFLEPGHLGTFGVFLLLTQIRKWNKWYNIIIFVAILMTFSLAGYVLLAMSIFGNVWIRRKAIVGKLIFVIGLFAAVAVISTFYNKGENLVNQLIVQRLTINEDGKLEGDNRVTDEFENEFNSFMDSSDVLTGREYILAKYGWGNAGYRVFIYDHGLISLLFVIVFYVSFSFPVIDKRRVIFMWLIAFASFLVRATPITFYYVIPLILLAGQRDEVSMNKKNE